MKSAASFQWDDEKLAILRRMWADGSTAQKIADTIGAASRNVVIGKINRLGLARSPGQRLITKVLTNRLRAYKSPNTGGARKVAAIRAARPSPAMPTLALVDGAAPKPWTERRWGECAWPVDGEGADTRSCCAPSEPSENGAQYCAAHWTIRGGKPVKTGNAYVRSLRRWVA